MASSDRIDELRKKFEENPRRYFAPLANEYRKAGEVDQAISICRDYLPQQPGHMSGHIVYGQALYEGRQFEEAKTVFETALSLDPENLIALRHLGDIALILGDTAGARTWYGRVLEADPRNEEIQAQLKSLESAAPPATAEDPANSDAAAEMADTAPTPVPSRAAITSPAQSAPTVVVAAMKLPEIERTVEQPAMKVPDLPPQVETLSSAPTAEITLDNVPMPGMPEIEKLTDPFASPDAPELTMGFEPTSAATDLPAAIEPLALDGPVLAASESPAIDAFTLDGLETTSMTPEPSSIPAPEPSGMAGAPLADLSPIDELKMDAPAPVEASVQPPVADIASVQAPIAEIPKALPESASSDSPTADLPMLDLGEGTSPVSAFEATTPIELPAPPAEEAAPPPAAETPATPAAPPAPTEPGPFVTETMAELYLSQGHRDEAVRVYRALIDQRPGDVQLRAKLEKLQADAGPTIRELLAKLARRRPGAVPSSGPSAGNGATEPAVPVAESPQPAAIAAVPAAPHAPAEAEAASPAVAPASTQNDRIAAILKAPAPDDDAERAARVLSSAFAGGRTTNGDRSDGNAIGGAPAHPASKDLSLDAVFGTPEAREAAPANFSFDQFFSQRATTEGGTGGATGGGQESRDDVAKFTQWLEGLKQR